MGQTISTSNVPYGFIGCSINADSTFQGFVDRAGHITYYDGVADDCISTNSNVVLVTPGAYISQLVLRGPAHPAEMGSLSMVDTAGNTTTVICHVDTAGVSDPSQYVQTYSAPNGQIISAVSIVSQEGQSKFMPLNLFNAVPMEMDLDFGTAGPIGYITQNNDFVGLIADGNRDVVFAGSSGTLPANFVHHYFPARFVLSSICFRRNVSYDNMDMPQASESIVMVATDGVETMTFNASIGSVIPIHDHFSVNSGDSVFDATQTIKSMRILISSNQVLKPSAVGADFLPISAELQRYVLPDLTLIPNSPPQIPTMTMSLSSTGTSTVQAVPVSVNTHQSIVSQAWFLPVVIIGSIVLLLALGGGTYYFFSRRASRDIRNGREEIVDASERPITLVSKLASDAQRLLNRSGTDIRRAAIDLENGEYQHSISDIADIARAGTAAARSASRDSIRASRAEVKDAASLARDAVDAPVAEAELTSNAILNQLRALQSRVEGETGRTTGASSRSASSTSSHGEGRSSRRRRSRVSQIA